MQTYQKLNLLILTIISSSIIWFNAFRTMTRGNPSLLHNTASSYSRKLFKNLKRRSMLYTTTNVKMTKCSTFLFVSTFHWHEITYSFRIPLCNFSRAASFPINKWNIITIIAICCIKIDMDKTLFEQEIYHGTTVDLNVRLQGGLCTLYIINLVCI